MPKDNFAQYATNNSIRAMHLIALQLQDSFGLEFNTGDLLNYFPLAKFILP